MNSNYEDDDFNPADLEAPVEYIHICGYKNEKNAGDEDGNPPTNHWATFLQISERESVRLDMAPGYGSDGQRGKINIASKTYVCSHNAIKALTFPLRAQATVRTIIDIINSNGRDRYNFTEEWEGCRFWMSTFISDLEGSGLVAPGSANATWDAVNLYWRYPDGSERREVKHGTFY
ncbi:uncharacterized protein DSM5745_00976 [Aspergillus mulundensis]|uniref:DUF7770 domain-containing protein n=1 Tax=Aspergillus mulundensis TaxID=1810919 RepID=A0A3D8T558_9EURO|nr:Uncharacterized protein DSM5745_00976 [Aspergillus mulundensis]RDW93654.1 Uncharacterized protein DSM5745_00976 [Aspergillus mulundensis]